MTNTYLPTVDDSPVGGEPPSRRGPWSPDEDRHLLELVAVYGPSNWVRIASSLATRTPKQCRERYHQNLKPLLNRAPISAEEGALIERLVAKHGKKWAEIARHLNGRSDNAVKNWWNGGASRRRRQSIQEGHTVYVGSSQMQASTLQASTLQASTLQANSNHGQVPQVPAVHAHAQHNQDPNPNPGQAPNLANPSSLALHGHAVLSHAPHHTHPHSAHSPKLFAMPPLAQAAPALLLQQIQPIQLAQSTLPHFKAAPSPYPLPNVPHIAFNTLMFDSHSARDLPFDAAVRPAGLGLSLFDQDNQKPQLPPPSIHPSKRRLLDDNQRRHSTGFVASHAPSTSPSGTILPYHSPLLLSHASRNNSVCHDLYLSSSGTLLTASRRSSIAPEWFNSLKDDKLHRREPSLNSYSPSLTPLSRFSVSSQASNVTSPNVPPAPAPTLSESTSPRKSRISVTSLLD